MTSRELYNFECLLLRSDFFLDVTELEVVLRDFKKAARDLHVPEVVIGYCEKGLRFSYQKRKRQANRETD